jgi:hypothetical protein
MGKQRRPIEGVAQIVPNPRLVRQSSRASFLGSILAGGAVVSGCSSSIQSVPQAPGLGSSGSPFNLIFINLSRTSGWFFLTQSQPGASASNVVSLVWLAKAINAHDVSLISWTTDYGVFCGTLGNFRPGFVVKASSTLPADLTFNNEVSLTSNALGPMFFDQTTSPAGGISIIADDKVSFPTVAGISMAGMPIFAVPVSPNQIYTFQPTLTIFVNFSAGLILPGSILPFPFPLPTSTVQLAFPAGLFRATVTMEFNNQISVKYSA